MRLQISEFRLAMAAVLLGLGVSVVLAPWDAYFLPNALFFWGSQVAVLAVCTFLKPRPIIFASIALALAVYLGTFGAWVFLSPSPESMAWLFYIFSLPGALVAAVISCVIFSNISKFSAWTTGAATFGMVIAGTALNLAAVFF